MKQHKSILGVHIDDDFLNIVHLRQTSAGLKVCNWLSEPLKQGVIKDGMIVDTETIKQIIQDFIKAGKQKVHKVIMIPSLLATKLILAEFDSQTTEELDAQVEEQIDKYTLFGNRRTVFDYCTFENAHTRNKQTVLEAITTKAISDTCLTVAQKTRLDLVRIEPAMLAFMKLVIDELPSESDVVSVLLTIDSSSGNILVCKGRQPQFCQNLNTGVKDLSRDDVNDSPLFSQMKSVLEFASSLSDSQEKPIVLRVAASCPGQELSHVIDKLRHHFSGLMVTPVSYAEIKFRFDIEDKGEDNLPIFACACAVTAICEFTFTQQLNLTSKQSLVRQQTQRQISLVAKICAAIMLLAIAAIYPFKLKAENITASSNELKVIIEKVEAKKQRAISMTEQIGRLDQEFSAYIATSRELNIPWPQVLRLIGNVLPEKVRIVNITTVKSMKFAIIGEALSEDNIYKFAKELQKADIVDIAEVEEIKYDDSNSFIMVNYRIICKIGPPGQSHDYGNISKTR